MIGPLMLDLPTPPTVPPPAQTQPSPPPPKPQPPAPGQTLQKQVEDILNGDNFDVPLVAEKPGVAPGAKSQAFLSTIPGVSTPGYPVNTPPELMTLDDITDVVYATLKGVSTKPGTRADVYSAVLKAYQDKMDEHEKSRWQFVISMLYTPQYFLWANQTLPSLWQNGYQLTAGATQRFHRYGEGGFEQSFLLQLSGSSFAFDSPDWFQNLLAVYQAAYVAPLGHEFRFLGAPGWWSYLQGSVFAQIAAGVGSPGERKLYLGVLGQGAIGGQLALNIGWLSVIVNGQFVYGWLSPTVEPASRPLSVFGTQFGLGLGGQF
jgi:hypothetical protein